MERVPSRVVVGAAPKTRAAVAVAARLRKRPVPVLRRPLVTAATLRLLSQLRPAVRRPRRRYKPVALMDKAELILVPVLMPILPDLRLAALLRRKDETAVTDSVDGPPSRFDRQTGPKQTVVT